MISKSRAFFGLKPWRMAGLVAIFILSAGCNHLFYFPDDVSYSDPKSYSFPIKAVAIKRAGKPPISAWIMNDTPQSRGFVLHFHGNAQNLTAHASFSAWLAEAGYTVLIFDYSGYGITEGVPSQEALIADSLDVAAWIAEGGSLNAAARHGPFIVFAQSLGGAVATTALAENPEFAARVDLLVVESSFDSYRRVAFQKLQSQPVSYIFSPLALALVSDFKKPSDAIQTLAMKTIIVHGNADTLVPFENGKALYEAARPPKEFWEIPFGNHTEAFVAGSPYRQQLLDAMQVLVPKGAL